MSDDISLVIGERAHDHWLSYRIDSDLIMPADDWQMMASVAGAVATSGPIAIPDFVFEGAIAKVTMGADLILDGMVDVVDHEVSKRGSTMELYGRDKASILLDCSAPLLSLQMATLEQIIKKAVGLLNIPKVVYQAQPSAPSRKVHTEPGQSVWQWLQSACELNQVWPWFAPNGVLVIGTPDYTAPIVADLVLRYSGVGNNVISLRRTNSLHDSYSEVTVLGQSASTEDSDGANVKGVATDDTVPFYRPKVIVDGNCDTSALAQQRASKLIADGKMNRDRLVAVVDGHRVGIKDNVGPPWAPGMRVNVYSEPHDVSAVYYLIGRTFSLSKRESRKTQLRLIPDRTWLLNLAFSKAKRRAGYGKRKGHYVGGDDGAE